MSHPGPLHPGHEHPTQQRNGVAVVSPAAMLEGHAHEHVVTAGEAFLLHTRAVHADNAKTHKQLFDHSHPVDEYQSTPGWPSGGVMEVTPTWETTERIDSILVGVPAGVTSVILQLGDRYIPVYVGVAAAAAKTYLIGPIGIILHRDDARYLNILPANLGAGPVFVELMGFAAEEWDAA